MTRILNISKYVFKSIIKVERGFESYNIGR